MDRNSIEMEAEILQHLEGLLLALPPAARVHPGPVNHLASYSPDPGFDAEIELTAGDVPVLLVVEVKRSLYPRDARQAIWRLQNAIAARPLAPGTLVIPFIAAQSISEGARQVLLTDDVGYADESGSLFLPAPPAYVFIDRPLAKAARKTFGSVFSGKRAQVVHAILASDMPTFGVNHISDMAQVSAATASETLSELERLEWVGSIGVGPSKMRFLKDATGLLDAWRKDIEVRVRRLDRQRFYVPGTNADGLRRKLAWACEQNAVPYVLTGEIAAQEYAPHLSSVSRVTCRFEQGAKVNNVLDLLEAKPVSEGANLEIVDQPTAGEFVGKRRIDGIWYASPVQVYLDLVRGEGRGKEAAEHLRQEVLRY